ncbi:MAG: pyruvate kinase, partial [Gammaproteobacteria bacterium]|nr:pyruvate kinase [Gammaproteobacteria bacterium]
MSANVVLRRTKIVATLGPASESEEMLKRLILAGVDVVRLNFSHGSPEEHKRRADMVRVLGKANGRQVGVLVDLQGPKIRTQRFINGSVKLKNKDEFVLDADLDKFSGDEKSVGITYKKLPQDVKKNDVLVLDDGMIVLAVKAVEGNKIITTVRVGGILSDNKGINLKGGGLSADALTEKDKADIKTAAEIDADYVAISFPRNAADVELARTLLRTAGGQGGIVAKIERTEALENIDGIIKASNAIMIARGDLGVEIGDDQLPAVQKSLIKKARDMNCVVITATQMMESMRTNPIPTRAEVFDVANAVLDGTDAVMLSAETAAGDYPSETVVAMARICRNAEQQSIVRTSGHRMDITFQAVDESIAMASMYTANHLNVRAIVSHTESGSTALWMSRISSGIPIYALSSHKHTRRKVTLYRGVNPVRFNPISKSHAGVNREIVEVLLNE